MASSLTVTAWQGFYSVSELAQYQLNYNNLRQCLDLAMRGSDARKAKLVDIIVHFACLQQFVQLSEVEAN